MRKSDPAMPAGPSRISKLSEPFAWPKPVVYGETENLPIVRVRCGRGFAYRDGDGRSIRKAEDRARFAALAIPPAWEMVRIAAKGNQHVQAIGRDARKRKQYRYHPLWIEQNKLRDFDRLPAFGSALPKIRAFVDGQLRRQVLDREHMVGIALRLLDRTLIRVGNDCYVEANGSYGLTTLTDRQVVARGNRVTFRFVGKGGKDVGLDLLDPRAARAIRRCHELPGHRLLQYFQDGGDVCPLTSTDINDMLRELTGETFTAKTFRTWGGTTDAFSRLTGQPLPGSETELKRTLNSHLRETAVLLGNTLAVCRKYYVHPKVIEGYELGMLARRKTEVKPLRGLDGVETAVLRFLADEGAPTH
jgi:DNA topoisomerase IB